jgi:predicted site-specific integrase-resolvase
MAMNQGYITPADAGQLLGVSVDSVRRFEREGALKAALKIRRGRRIDRLFRERDVLKFRARREANATAR